MLSLWHSLATISIGSESDGLGKNRYPFRVVPGFRSERLAAFQTFFSRNCQLKAFTVFFKECGGKDPRPRYPRVWKTRKKIETVSKSLKLVECIKGLSNVKEEVYGALDSFIAWELEFPLITVKKAVKSLEYEKEWKRIIQLTKWMLSKGQGKTMGSYYTLLNALAEDGRLEEAEELWQTLFSQNLESMPRMFFEKMISLYYRNEMHDKMFEIFADMEELGMRPTMPILTMVGNGFKTLDMLEKYKKLWKKYWYVKVKSKRLRRNVDSHDMRSGIDSGEVKGSDLVESSDSSMLHENGVC